MKKAETSLFNTHQNSNKVETSAKIILTCLAITSILAVIAITVYMILSGMPPLFEQGINEILFGTIWQPTADNPSYGILYVILTSIIGVTLAIFIGVPIGVLTAVYVTEIAPPKSQGVLESAIALLAGIPSVVYGLLGVLLLNPFVYQIELWIFKDSSTHQFTGGSNLLCAVLVLAIMILPTLISVCITTLQAVPSHYRRSSLALGASQVQTIFKVLLPSAKRGIASAIVLGIGRAMGEAMAVVLVAGNAINLPLPFSSVRFLTTAIVSEMGYAQGTHREVLFTIGLVLFVFIMLINIMLMQVLRRGRD